MYLATFNCRKTFSGLFHTRYMSWIKWPLLLWYKNEMLPNDALNLKKSICAPHLSKLNLRARADRDSMSGLASSHET